ncbi:hypothetical protein [Mycobacteroides abscessus]|uniref:hypothetical protein n=1 Tax=Mycobacteroides abscessus TaxID=36809 RepID=UPI001F2EF8BE|nr:hypothetical protein [Mycobacteroides abscessus]
MEAESGQVADRVINHLDIRFYDTVHRGSVCERIGKFTAVSHQIEDRHHLAPVGMCALHSGDKPPDACPAKLPVSTDMLLASDPSLLRIAVPVCSGRGEQGPVFVNLNRPSLVDQVNGRMGGGGKLRLAV